MVIGTYGVIWGYVEVYEYIRKTLDSTHFLVTALIHHSTISSTFHEEISNLSDIKYH